MSDIEIRIIGSDSPEFSHALRLREEVFVREQGVPLADEIDGLDDEAIHMVAVRGEEIIGTLRLLDKQSSMRVGRVSVRASERNQGIGTLLLQAAEKHARARGYQRMILLSQLPVVPFYERLGFAKEGEILLDAGLSSVWMQKDLDPHTTAQERI